LKYIMPGTERLTARTKGNSRLFSNHLVGPPFLYLRITFLLLSTLYLKNYSELGFW
jgi:hypothetical protein